MFVRAFRTPGLRQKLLFTGAMIVLFRFGSNLPAPGISEQNVSYCSRMSSSSGVFAILNLLSGNSLLHGIRPGPPTSAHLRYVLNRLTAPGSIYLALVAMFPLVALDKIGLGQDLQLSGVSLLIMVGVGLDTIKQIHSQLQQHSYEGFLR